MPSTPKWFCAQLGGREHYAVPRALHGVGALDRLLTDFWAGNYTKAIGEKLPGQLFRSLAARQHEDLPGELVTSWNAKSMGWEALLRRSSRRSGVAGRYRGYCAGGRRFSSNLIRWFSKARTLPDKSIFFGYDTCGLEVMEYLQKRGVRCILDQIDPGRVEVEMVKAEQLAWPGWEDQPLDIPEEFFERHHLEWDMADKIMVNSVWSRDALIQQGVPPGKIVVVPLSFEQKSQSGEVPLGDVTERRMQDHCSFSYQNPLKVLFLGQVMLRKGIQYLAKAAELLLHEPVCFDVVGPMHLSAMAVTSMPRNMRIQGRASRDEINSWYKEADVFVLPTISDGFALTQIEAMANGLPVITTPNCGDVVTDGVDGYIVAPRDPTALAAAIMRYVQDPGSLACHKEAAVVKSKQFTLSRLATSLLALGESLQG